MKFVKNVSEEHQNLIVDKIISFIKTGKKYTLYENRVIFNDNDIEYKLFNNIFRDEILHVIVSNHQKNISIIFDIKNIKDVVKYNFINSNLLPLILNNNKPLDDNEFFESFNITPDKTIDRSKKLSKVLKLIKKIF